MSEIDSEPFPRGALIAVGALVAISLVATTWGRLARPNAPAPVFTTPQPAPTQTVDLHFIDEANGSVTVREAGSGRMIATLAPGTNGFVRGVVRGLAHDRKTRHIGAGPPFRLSRWNDKSLTLKDTATGRLIDLDSFGVGNKDDFAQLLGPGGAKS